MESNALGSANYLKETHLPCNRILLLLVTKLEELFYPNISSAMRPVSYGEGLPEPKEPNELHVDSDDEVLRRRRIS